jgi:Electron transfer DM13
MISFFRRHRTLTIVVGLLALAGGWFLFRPEKLFINQKVNEAAPFNSSSSELPVYTGVLASKLHETSGRATIYRTQNGAMSLHLTGFHTSNGPDVHVVLAASSDPALQAITPGKALESIEIGALKGNEGDQEYVLPAHLDLTRYNTIAIYCERFRAVFGTAKLDAF